MDARSDTRYVETLVIGGGQAGLSVGYHLKKRGLPFLILDASARLGDAWRERWDSLRLFTPARFSALDGLPFPSAWNYFPTKDEMADYLESYATHFDLPVLSGMRVDRLWREDGRFIASVGGRRYEADNVVVAMSTFQRPKTPDFAEQLDPSITQVHSFEYRNPDQLRNGPVLLVGAGNSGAEIALELARHRTVWMSGPDVGHIPFRVEPRLSQLLLVPLVLRIIFHRVLSVATPIGRKARGKMLRKAAPLVRVKPKDLQRAGVERVGRTTGVQDGRPILDDGRVLKVANVIWCTGFDAGLDWIDLPVHDEHEPRHTSGVVESEPGLYFVGLHFLHANSSAMIHGVGRDAERITGLIEARRADNRHAGEVAIKVA